MIVIAVRRTFLFQKRVFSDAEILFVQLTMDNWMKELILHPAPKSQYVKISNNPLEFIVG